MTVTAYAGPLITYGITQTSTGQVTEYNEERGTSLNDLGQGIMDPRPFYKYVPGNAVGTKVGGFYDNQAYVDYVPFTASSNALVSNGSSQTLGALTLTATGAGVITTNIVAPESGQTVSVFALDSTAAFLPMGQSGTVALWNPAAGTGRVLTVTASSSGTTGQTISVAGRDMYGFKITETITFSTASGATAGTGQKAFKYISGISASTGVTAGFLVGTTDTYGFPLKVAYCGQQTVIALLATSFSSAALVLFSSANTILASTSAAQSATTPDVRGTYASTTASNGTLRLQIFQGTTANMMASITASDQSAMFGATQFSSV